eukprot:gene16209-17840_t
MDTATAIVKYTSQTIGRDKLTRAMQYASKIIWYTSEKKNIDPEFVAKIKRLEVYLSTSRKTFRLGKSLDMFLGAIRGSQVQDPLIRVCIVIARISRTVYFFYDIFNWCCRVTLMKGSSKEYAMRAAPFWFIAVVCGLIRDLYELINYVLRAKAKKQDVGIQNCLCQRPDIATDTLKNICDFLIPLKIWGKLDLSQGTVGILGLISSLCGILTVVKPACKLTPM